MAGFNLRIRLWHIAEDTDDAVGGAMITGSVVGEYPARMQGQPTDQIFLQQGLETNRTFRITMIPGTVPVYERDEVEIVHPFNHRYFGVRFRVVGVTYSDLNPYDPRNYLMLDLTRSVIAHSQQ